MMGVPGLPEAAQVEGEGGGVRPPCEEGGQGCDQAGTEAGHPIMSDDGTELLQTDRETSSRASRRTSW